MVAERDRAGASSMYLFAYYAGSSIVGWFSGAVFGHFGWMALEVWLGILAIVAGIAATYGLRGESEK
ncbi:hypothetical protein KRX51_01680 [Corynebacterium sp. TAE3-ERU12]|uniref:hypothetical protein n=1 Tax=Corynebacterium sp. TAE3-ERU12 TaxID=2849491 RepID=UPI001C48F3EF|nr:hypothetical protein [Corynebacterium sp. TAE3-ERU12]MBV7294627.1 hypothetical protein [Corynebacterium sp. TAE3-ERU12]